MAALALTNGSLCLACHLAGFMIGPWFCQVLNCPNTPISIKTITTPDPQAPRSVVSYCTFITWQAPSTVYSVITGYDVMFLKSTADLNNYVVTKGRNELFHIGEHTGW